MSYNYYISGYLNILLSLGHEPYLCLICNLSKFVPQRQNLSCCYKNDLRNRLQQCFFVLAWIEVNNNSIPFKYKKILTVIINNKTPWPQSVLKLRYLQISELLIYIIQSFFPRPNTNTWVYCHQTVPMFQIKDQCKNRNARWSWCYKLILVQNKLPWLYSSGYEHWKAIN